MNEKRLLELLVNAIVCFERCSSPFSLSQLSKRNITANECRDLSNQIASILEEWISEMYEYKEIEKALEERRAEED